MTPEPGNADEAEGVLNPASGRGPDGQLYLLPRLVAEGNVSRVGIARVVIDDGVPVSVEREGIVLQPDRGWERGVGNAGTEDPRTTWIEALGLHVMTYVAYGPLGPRTAVAVSEDLREWKRLGPAMFRYQDDLDMDLNLFHNKDTVFFPSRSRRPTAPSRSRCCTARCGTSARPSPARACACRPGSKTSGSRSGSATCPSRPSATTSRRSRSGDSTASSRGPQYPFEEVKIGGGPPPLRIPRGGSCCTTG